MSGKSITDDVSFVVIAHAKAAKGKVSYCDPQLMKRTPRWLRLSATRAESRAVYQKYTRTNGSLLL